MKKNATLKLLRKKSPVFLYKKPLVIKLSILSSFSSFGIALVESTLMLKTEMSQSMSSCFYVQSTETA